MCVTGYARNFHWNRLLRQRKIPLRQIHLLRGHQSLPPRHPRLILYLGIIVWEFFKSMKYLDYSDAVYHLESLDPCLPLSLLLLYQPKIHTLPIIQFMDHLQLHIWPSSSSRSLLLSTLWLHLLLFPDLQMLLPLSLLVITNRHLHRPTTLVHINSRSNTSIRKISNSNTSSQGHKDNPKDRHHTPPVLVNLPNSPLTLMRNQRPLPIEYPQFQDHQTNPPLRKLQFKGPQQVQDLPNLY